jgi:CheY-like chemotaxis protein
MQNIKYNLLLADDDRDDCIFFRDALDDLPVEINLATVNDGVELMNFLRKNSPETPDLLFLDLNMPRKNGFECLTELKSNSQLKNIPVIIFSTSLDMQIADLLYEKGAHHYIRKPNNFLKLKKIINEALTLTSMNNYKQPGKDKFILQA